MKIWFNKVNESRRSMIEVENGDVHIGREGTNNLVLRSPLVSRRHAIVRRSDGNGQLELENVGVNSCLVGETEVLGGERIVFDAGVKVRIWPYTISFETETTTAVSRAELEAHLRSIVAELELKIHKKLLERLDLYEMETMRGDLSESIVLLENNIEDVCRDLNIFGQDNAALLEEVTGLGMRDHLINQLIMEQGDDEVFDLAALTSNEFDIPLTLVPRTRNRTAQPTKIPPRETVLRAPCRMSPPRFIASRDQFDDHFHLVRPHLHARATQVLDPADAQEGLEGYCFRLWAASGLAASADNQRNHGRQERSDLRRE